MGFWKFKFYIELFSIAVNLFLVPWMVVGVVSGQILPGHAPLDLSLLTVCWYMMLTRNDTWKDLLRKWKGGGKR